MAIRICIFFISLLLAGEALTWSQDTVTVPLYIRAGVDLSGPVMKLVSKELISYRVNASTDLTPALAVTTAIGYSSYHSTRPIYDFRSRGMDIRAGVDYNFLKANISKGEHYAGIGMRYGLSFYREEASMIRYTNEWGAGETTLPPERHTGHFVELTPGVRTRLFPGVTIGWNIYLRLLLSTGAGSGLKPVWMPGYGTGTSPTAAWAEYYISLTLPYRKVKTIIRPKVQESDDDDERQGVTTSGSVMPGVTGR